MDAAAAAAVAAAAAAAVAVPAPIVPVLLLPPPPPSAEPAAPASSSGGFEGVARRFWGMVLLACGLLFVVVFVVVCWRWVSMIFIDRSHLLLA